MSDKAHFLEKVWFKSKSDLRPSKFKFSRISSSGIGIVKGAETVEDPSERVSGVQKHSDNENRMSFEATSSKYFEIPIVSINSGYEALLGSPPKSVSFGSDEIVVFNEDGIAECHGTSDNTPKNELNLDTTNINFNFEVLEENEEAREVLDTGKSNILELSESESSGDEKEVNQEIFISTNTLPDDLKVQEIQALRSDAAELQQKLNNRNYGEANINEPTFKTMPHESAIGSPQKSARLIGGSQDSEQCTTQDTHQPSMIQVDFFEEEPNISSEEVTLGKSGALEQGKGGCFNENESPSENKKDRGSQVEKADHEFVLESKSGVLLEWESIEHGVFSDRKATLPMECARHDSETLNEEYSSSNQGDFVQSNPSICFTTETEGYQSNGTLIGSQLVVNELPANVEEVDFQARFGMKDSGNSIESEQLFNQDMEELRREQQNLHAHTTTTSKDSDSCDKQNALITQENELLRLELTALRDRYDLLTRTKRQDIKELEEKLTKQIEECQDLRQNCDLILEDFSRISLRATRESIVFKETLEDVKQLRRDVRDKSKKTDESIRECQYLENYYRDYIVALGRVVNITGKYLAPISCDSFRTLFQQMATFNVKYPSDQELTNLREILPIAMKATITSYISAQKKQSLQNRKLVRILKATRQKARQYRSRDSAPRARYSKCRGLMGLSLPKSSKWQRA